MRWLYKLGVRRMPEHPKMLGGFRVVTEVRDIAYLGEPPPGFFRRLVDRVRRAV